LCNIWMQIACQIRSGWLRGRILRGRILRGRIAGPGEPESRVDSHTQAAKNGRAAVEI
jgi:hypothetical protein